MSDKRNLLNFYWTSFLLAFMEFLIERRQEAVVIIDALTQT